jgi:hypothetical protein
MLQWSLNEIGALRSPPPAPLHRGRHRLRVRLLRRCSPPPSITGPARYKREAVAEIFRIIVTDAAGETSGGKDRVGDAAGVHGEVGRTPL